MASLSTSLIITLCVAALTAGHPLFPLHSLHCEQSEEHRAEVDHVLDVSDLDLQKLTEHVGAKVVLLKGGAVGAATKGLLLAKKGAYIAGRAFLKPFAIITGLHLKFIGSGLTLGGKLIGGAGAGIAKTGTVVKYAGLGGIGLGASAVGWGLDKSTIDTHFSESHRKFNN